VAGKFGSASAFIFVDGYDLRAAKVKTLNHKIESLTEEGAGLGDTSEAAIPVGMSRITLTQGGAFFDTAAGSSHAALSGGLPTTPQSTPRIVCCGFAGQVLEAAFYGMEGAFSHVYEVMAQVAALIKANVEYKISGQLDRGQIIQPLVTKTADWNTKTLGTPVDFTADPTQRVIPITSNSQANPTVVTTPVPHGLTTGQVILISGVAASSPTINGERTVTVISETTFSVPVDTSAGSAGTGGSFVLASTVNGGVGYQHVKTSTGFTNFVGKIRDSADDTTYADLVVFGDNVVAPYAERVEVAGTIDRYVSFDGNVTGTGSIEVFAGLARS
jgi:hypothetical protein